LLTFAFANMVRRPELCSDCTSSDWLRPRWVFEVGDVGGAPLLDEFVEWVWR